METARASYHFQHREVAVLVAEPLDDGRQGEELEVLGTQEAALVPALAQHTRGPIMVGKCVKQRVQLRPGFLSKTPAL